MYAQEIVKVFSLGGLGVTVLYCVAVKTYCSVVVLLFTKMQNDQHCIGAIDPDCDILSIAEGETKYFVYSDVLCVLYCTLYTYYLAFCMCIS